jgi:hypothetical protein
VAHQSVLHIANGDSTAGTLRYAGLPGTVAVWADVLHEGPVPPDDDMDAWLAVRSRFHAGSVWSYDEALSKGRQWQADLESFPSYHELLFWFEHDLFDQLALVRHLAWLDRQDRGSTRVTLICIGEFPDFPGFIGLGQLSAEQLASLYPTRKEVTPEQLALARRTWDAFTASDPTTLVTLAQDHRALPFLGPALRRFLEEYPSVRNGLPRSETQVLRALEGGPLSPGRLYVRSQEPEEARFMGDSTLWERVEELGAGPNPLARLDVTRRKQALPEGKVTLTDTGRAVLAGEVDWAAAHRLDRWYGGVHLESDRGHWRWDGSGGLLVAAAAVRPEQG